MKVIITGGSGQIGQILRRDFAARRWETIVLGRQPPPIPLAGARFVPWDGKTPGDWCSEVDGADLVINLAGRNVNCRYTTANRQQIIDSRVDSTRAVVAAIARAERPPPLLLQASTATIYSHRFDGANDDVHGRIGGDERNVPESWRFSIDVARAWETAAMEIDLPATRRVLMRSAMTMSPDRGGIFDVLLRLVRLGLGGRCGNGRQYVSWIHEIDFIAAVHWLVGHQELAGPINLSSPNPLTHADFMRILRRAWRQPFGLPASRWMLELGAVALQTETELILKSRRVIPTRLVDSGFPFQFPHWQEAAADLCRRRRANRVPTGGAEVTGERALTRDTIGV